MTKDRALHELINWACGVRTLLLEWQEADSHHTLIDARLKEINYLLKETKPFIPTIEQLKEWEKSCASTRGDGPS
jgi:hypothetical protein